MRQNLDARLVRVREHLEVRPDLGWLRTIREALGMSTYELARRMDLSQTRVRQFEEAERQGSIRLSTMNRVAEALNCKFLYVLVPNESLEEMVHRQARHKAATQLSISDPDTLENEADDLADLRRVVQLDDLTTQFVDRQGLWT